MLCQRLWLNNKQGGGGETADGRKAELTQRFCRVRAIIGKKYRKSRANAIKSVKVNSVPDSAT